MVLQDFQIMYLPFVAFNISSTSVGVICCHNTLVKLYPCFSVPSTLIWKVWKTVFCSLHRIFLIVFIFLHPIILQYLKQICNNVTLYFDVTALDICIQNIFFRLLLLFHCYGEEKTQNQIYLHTKITCKLSYLIHANTHKT